MGSTAVTHRHERGDGAFGVAGGQVERHRRVTQRQPVPVGRHDVAGRLPGRVLTVEQRPVGLRHHHLCAEPLLQVLRAARVVEMGMADHHVLDVGRVEPQRRQPVDDLVLDRVVEDGVDQDDAVRGGHRPGRVLGHPDEVQVVEDLHRFGVPRIPRWRRSRPAARAGAARARGAEGLRLGADAVEQPDVVTPRRLPGRLDMPLDLRRRLRRHGARGEHRRQRERDYQTSHVSLPLLPCGLVGPTPWCAPMIA